MGCAVKLYFNCYRINPRHPRAGLARITLKIRKMR